MSDIDRRLAVLVDADNVSPRWAGAVFKEVATFGDATVRRVYGNFASEALRPWRHVLQDHALQPYHQPAYTKGKNSSDIALVIDAMDLLHSGHVDGFVLVSSDSDFTRLASRIRERGLDVIGIGEEKTPESLRRACKRFIFLENLEVAETGAAADGSPVASGAEASHGTDSGEGALPKAAGPAGPREREPPSKVVPLVLDAMRTVEEEWVSLSVIGSHLHAANHDFDPRTYGCSKLSDLLERAGAFEVNRKKVPVRVRRKRTMHA